jgi:hypothetical protein
MLVITTLLIVATPIVTFAALLYISGTLRTVNRLIDAQIAQTANQDKIRKHLKRIADVLERDLWSIAMTLETMSDDMADVISDMKGQDDMKSMLETYEAINGQGDTKDLRSMPAFMEIARHLGIDPEGELTAEHLFLIDKELNERIALWDQQQDEKKK